MPKDATGILRPTPGNPGLSSKNAKDANSHIPPPETVRKIISGICELYIFSRSRPRRSANAFRRNPPASTPKFPADADVARVRARADLYVVIFTTHEFVYVL